MARVMVQVPSDLVSGELDGLLPAETVLAFCTLILYTEVTEEELAKRYGLANDAIEAAITYMGDDSDAPVESPNPTTSPVLTPMTQETLENVIYAKLYEAFPDRPAKPENVTRIAAALTEYGAPNEPDFLADIILVMQQQDGTSNIARPDSYLLRLTREGVDAMHEQADEIRRKGRSKSSIIQEAMRRTEVALQGVEPPQASDDNLALLKLTQARLGGAAIGKPESWS